MTLELNSKIRVKELRLGLQARKWEITSDLPDEVKAEMGQYTIVIRSSSITFSGFIPRELLGGKAVPAKVAIAGGILAVVGGGGRAAVRR